MRMSQIAGTVVRRPGDVAAGSCLILTFAVGLLGLLFPTRDFAGLGDSSLEAIVSRDDLFVATLFAVPATVVSLILLTTYAMWRSRAVWLAAVVLALCGYNLARCLAYYYLHPELIHPYG